MVKRRDIISLLCMIAFSVPLIIYFFGGGLIVHADEATYVSDILDTNGHIIDETGYINSSIYDVNSKPSQVLASDSSNFSIYFDGDLTNGEATIDSSSVASVAIDQAGTSQLYNISINDSDFVFISVDSYGTFTIRCFKKMFNCPDFYFISLDNGINVLSTSTGYYDYVLTDGNGTPIWSTTIYGIACSYTGRISNNVLNFTLSSSSASIVNQFSNIREQSGDYLHFGNFSLGYSSNIIFCDHDLFTVANGSETNTILNVFGYSDSSGNSYSGDTTTYNVNYESLENNDDSSTYPDGSGGDVTNNMYLETADWKFNIPKYWGNVTSTLVQPKYTANWGSGTVSFYGLCNDFIQDNADDYKLHFNFYVKCNGHRFSDTHSEIDENFAKSFAWRSVEYDLSDYVNNKSINIDFTISDIFSHCWDQGMSTNVTNYLETIKTYNSIDNWDWSLSCDAQIVSGSYTSGSIQENYNFISQVSKEVSNTITQNNNPYYPEDENGKPIIPDSDGTSSITDKNGNITLTNYDNDNNNQSVVINGNDKSVIDGLIDKLVPNAQGNGGLTERFVNLTNANGWFAVMSSALPLMGSDFWSTLQLMFVTSLGILGCAFVIWIIVHII